jgi:hypothetical protein
MTDTGCAVLRTCSRWPKTVDLCKFDVALMNAEK